MAKPRSIKGAGKRGWTVVYVPRNDARSWIGTLNWIHKNRRGEFISEYKWQGDGLVAFENADDAATAVLFLDAVQQEVDNKSKV